MTVTQAGRLSPEDEQQLKSGGADYAEVVEHARRKFKRLALEMVEKSSYREVERVTGVSTTTLQRWKREVRK